MIDLTKQLCALDAASGNEDSVRKFILKRLENLNVQCKTDALGNIIGYKDGTKLSKSFMLCAHMDEVAMVITSINNDGTLQFSNIGGISGEALIGKAVRINGICGVIGSKAVHNMTADEKKSKINSDSLYIDIGCDNSESAYKLVNLGDCAYFDNDCNDFGDSLLIGKAIDDRAGCAILLKLIENSEYSFSFAFTVQEEVGARGAGPAAFALNPEIAIVLEATTAADIPASSGSDKVCIVKNGAVIGFMDRSTVYDKELFNLALKVSEAQKIKCQIKTKVAGGNDSGTIHKTAGGIRCLAISIPCRYLHSSVCVAAKEDIESVYRLSDAVLAEFADRKAEGI